MKGISVIVTFYKGLSSLELCLSILKKSLEKEDCWEIIVANDNPSEQIDFVTQKYNARLLTMPYNLGYAGACNRAAAVSLYDTLLFIDCDIYPSGNWLEHMKKTFSEIREEGCVSATIYEADTGNLFGYGMGIYEVDILLFLRHGIPTGFCLEDRDVPIVSSGCMMISRKLYLDIGGQDELCMNIHCDVDLAFRMRLKGYRNRMCAKAKVFHRGQISGPIRTIPFRQDVKAYLYKKWGAELGKLCNIKSIMEQLWSYFNAQRIKGKNVIVISLSNSLYRHDYIDMMSAYFDLHILQFHDIKNITGSSHILLQEAVHWDICRSNVPIVYFADDYRILHNNYYWFINRPQLPDLIADKNGNLMYAADYWESVNN